MVLLTCGCDPETGKKCATGYQLRREYARLLKQEEDATQAKVLALHALQNHVVYDTEPAA